MKSLLKLSVKQFLLIASFILIAVSANAQVTYTDTVCASTLDKVYGIMNANSTSNYAWSLSDPAAGTIDNSFAPNDSIIEIDWSTNVGTYTLFAIETTANGCIGDTIALDVVINALPTVAFAADSVCPGYSPTLTFTFTGEAPWVVEYTDGNTNFTDTAAASPFTATLPTYTTTQSITVTAVTDGNTCGADAGGLPTTPAYVYPAPTPSGSIYHY